MKKLLSILITFCLIAANVVIPVGASRDIKNDLIYKTTNNGFTLSGEVSDEGTINESDRISMVVLYPDKNFDEINTENAFMNAVCHVDAYNAEKNGDAFTLSFEATEDMPYGIYTIVLTRYYNNKDTETVTYLFPRINPAEISDFLSEFKALTKDCDFGAFLDKYLQKKFIQKEQMPEILNGLPENFEEMCVYLCGIYEEEDNFKEIVDVVDCLNGAYILSMFEKADEVKAKEALLKYSDSIENIYDEKVDTEKFLMVYSDLKEKITDSKSLKDILYASCKLSVVQNSSRKQMAEFIENNSEFLGCDITYATQKGISLLEAATYINTEKVSSFYGGDFQDIFEKAVDTASGNQTSQDGGSKKPVSGGGGKGSSSSGNSIYVPIVNETETTPETTPHAEFKNIPFTDIENISWAKDYIISLYEKGIINGNGDGTFAPNRLVTREEFVKMIVEAFDIDVKKEGITFDDCDVLSWYYPYVQIAASNDIVKGIDKYNFGVGQTIKRQDIAVMMERVFILKKVGAYASGHKFSDDENIGTYAKGAIDKMYTIGVISGFEDGTFRGMEGTTRAQATVIIGRALECMGGAK